MMFLVGYLFGGFFKDAEYKDILRSNKISIDGYKDTVQMYKDIIEDIYI